MSANAIQVHPLRRMLDSTNSDLVVARVRFRSVCLEETTRAANSLTPNDRSYARNVLGASDFAGIANLESSQIPPRVRDKLDAFSSGLFGDDSALYSSAADFASSDLPSRALYSSARKVMRLLDLSIALQYCLDFTSSVPESRINSAFDNLDKADLLKIGPDNIEYISSHSPSQSIREHAEWLLFFIKSTSLSSKLGEKKSFEN